MCALNKALLTFGFFGALRGSEYTATASGSGTISAPRLNNVQFLSVESKLSYKFTISKSKTSSKPIQVYVGCSGTEVCAVCALKDYLAYRSLNIGLHPESYLFCDSQGRPIHKDYLNKLIKQGMLALGLDSGLYSSHSLRSGAATTASQLGFNDADLKALGHWRSTAYLTYIHNSQQHRFNYSARLASQPL